ncbi:MULTISPECIES: hypothetical protein [unclassified Paenibacillus]|uniref:hypothetical protein n=1 Tax=unclassified Paenibacillus TaxID=185978 RepID=UPI0008C31285|nr:MULTISPECIES: hypothetical protein [unclassified Paenibacillus]QLG42011.1 hypothetical protein HW560_30420 [Paenibacillus sp. E222]SEM97303.1 hypothetical protein SAMN05518670_0740 [Paenibacillus sp. OK076]
MLKKISKSVLALILVTTLFSSLTYADNSGESNEYTPEMYVDYLTELINNGDVGASESLNQFNGLEPSKQETFLRFITSIDYAEAIEDIATGEKETTYNYNGEEVPVTVVDESSSNGTQGGKSSTNALAAANTAASASKSFTFSVFGVDTTTITLTVSWEHNGSVAVRPLQVSYAHVNRNPAFILSETSNNNPGYISEGYFHGSGTWTMRATGAIGFVSDTLGINIKASTPAHRYYSFSSTKGNVKPIPWTAF